MGKIHIPAGHVTNGLQRMDQRLLLLSESPVFPRLTPPSHLLTPPSHLRMPPTLYLKPSLSLWRGHALALWVAQHGKHLFHELCSGVPVGTACILQRHSEAAGHLEFLPLF
ncbi:hypothetical protein DPEC_G00225530 [Dallia pectoralis]|uniref:Uncharacterized protein n=1 Tax=Dallia pectoralis TaxID=75939 RepID=A0ACC2G0E4_DALPE|nr:hypothetical protein DPEC_G00225530 [Dallia pectoralis]